MRATARAADALNLRSEGDLHPEREGKITRFIENQTARAPSVSFLALAAGAIGLSLFFKLKKRDEAANFVGLWTPTILILGLYNKLVKVEGSERD